LSRERLLVSSLGLPVSQPRRWTSFASFMRNRHAGSLLAAVFLCWQPVAGQTFENLDFEQATIAPTPVGGASGPADPSQCFPGWTVGGSGTVVSYNDLSIGAPAVDLMGPYFPNPPGYVPLQGYYSVLLQYFGIAGTAPSLSQSGLVPVGTESINFLVGSGQSDAVVTLNGVNIPLVSLPDGRWAGDVSAFAGTVAQLTLFPTSNTGYGGNWLYFDDIQFSPSSVPEPNGLSLCSICILIFLWRGERSNTCKARGVNGKRIWSGSFSDFRWRPQSGNGRLNF
jgi:hypothetical protein